MSGRPTAEIGADVRRRAGYVIGDVNRRAMYAAADRLAELDAEVLRLPCPTCGGDQRFHCNGCNAEWFDLGECTCTCTDDDENYEAWKIVACPDCTDGRMSHERAWKIVAAVFDDEVAVWRSQWPRDVLRGIR